MPLLVIEHPLGGERPDAVVRRSQQALEQLAALISGAAAAGAGGAGAGRHVGALVEKDEVVELTLEDDAMALLAEFSAREWCDGLPFVPPTPERVAAFALRRCSTALTP